MSDRSLCRGHVDLAVRPPTLGHQRLDRPVLRLIAQLRRRGVGVDVVHVLRLGAGVPQRHLHRPHRSATTRQRRGQVVRVGARAVAHDLGVDGGAAVARVVELFQHHDASALADDEAGAVAVEGPRGAARVVVEAGGEATRAAEPADGQRVDAGLGAAGDHDGGVAVRDEAAGVADGVRARGAGCCHGVVCALIIEVSVREGTQLDFCGRYFKAISHGYMASSKIDENFRHEKRLDFAGILVMMSENLVISMFLEHDGGLYPFPVGDRCIEKFFEITYSRTKTHTLWIRSERPNNIRVRNGEPFLQGPLLSSASSQRQSMPPPRQQVHIERTWQSCRFPNQRFRSEISEPVVLMSPYRSIEPIRSFPSSLCFWVDRNQSCNLSGHFTETASE